MKRLIELLNQFEEEKKSDNRWGLTYIDNELMGLSNIREARLAVISKEYGFIKWLVENDKIDYDRYIKEFKLKDFRKFYYISKADNVIANLSIQDSPIDFLVSILK